jgi:Tfp pilus assembly protein PilX
MTTYFKSKNNKQLGAVSLFVVVFAALLLTIITISFVRIMVQDQQQATANDLARSAYDSAQAGVEDAKRAILKAQSICMNGGDCLDAYSKINSDTCNLAVGSWIGNNNDNNGEVAIQNSSTQNLLDQAYTCVKIKTNTPDYLGTLAKDSSKLVPLAGDGRFNKIKIEWFSQNDTSSSDSSIDLLSSSDAPLLNQNDWPLNRPPVIRAQMIQFSGDFNLSDFEGSGINGYNNTLFLYPSAIGLSDNLSFATSRKTASFKPVLIQCQGLDMNAYACSATISLNATVDVENRNTFLNIEALYGKTSYRVSLLDDTNSVVDFKNIQPEIDSTGRANDYFKRVKVRVELNDTNLTYPIAEVSVSGSFCKSFTVTDNPSDYKSQCSP